jgi:hypothetical protein
MKEEDRKPDEAGYPMTPAIPERIPESTFWPFVLAIGVMFSFWGILTSWIISGIGVVLISVSFAGWISDLNFENGIDGTEED